MRFWAILTILSLSVGVMSRVRAAESNEIRSAQEIRYVSADLRSAMVFAGGMVRAGNILALSPGLIPPSPTRMFETRDHVQCLAAGVSGSDVEFAIRKPIRMGDQYTCLRTAFRVIRCFARCRAAIIEVESRLGGGVVGTRKSYMYVDSCIGLLAFSQVHDLSHGLPLDAVWLRGDVGILADDNYPLCNTY